MTEGRNPSAGFTLIEVLISLAILGVVLTVFARTVSTQANADQRVNASVQAVLFARSTMERLGRDIALVPGQQSGPFEGDGRWVLTVSPLAPPTQTASGRRPALAYVVQLVVSRPHLETIALISIRLPGRWVSGQ